MKHKQTKTVKGTLYCNILSSIGVVAIILTLSLGIKTIIDPRYKKGDCAMSKVDVPWKPIGVYYIRESSKYGLYGYDKIGLYYRGKLNRVTLDIYNTKDTDDFDDLTVKVECPKDSEYE